MRKRVAITVLALGGIAAGCVLLSMRKRETVEWHKDQYLAFRYPHRGFNERVTRLWRKVLGRPGEFWCWSAEDDDRLKQLEQPLISLGYLERRSFGVVDLSRVYRGAFTNRALQTDFFSIRPSGTGNVVIVDRAERMPAWERFVSKADAPQ